MGSRRPSLQTHLDDLRGRYGAPADLDQDPLSLVLPYKAPLDREVASFLAATLAYGRVGPMIRAIQAALAPLGPEPAAWLRAHGPGEARRLLQRELRQWVWRFHTGPDVVAWLEAWRRLDRESGRGLEPHLSEGPPDEALSRLVRRLRRELPDTYGTRFSLPDPLEGSACKRWRLLLRWMVRDGWPDLGLWRELKASELIIPLDTHVARVSRFVGLSQRATPDGRMAEEITAHLRKLDGADPLKYDFALSHLGIQGDCPGARHRQHCRGCALFPVCRAR